MGNPLLDRLAKRLHGTKSERRVAKDTRGRLTPASGSKTGAKSDIVLPALRIEAKSTVYESLSLQKAWLDKITREALETNRAPALTLSFVTGSGAAKPNGDWIAIPAWLAKRIGLV